MPILTDKPAILIPAAVALQDRLRQMRDRMKNLFHLSDELFEVIFEPLRISTFFAGSHCILLAYDGCRVSSERFHSNITLSGPQLGRLPTVRFYLKCSDSCQSAFGEMNETTVCLNMGWKGECRHLGTNGGSRHVPSKSRAAATRPVGGDEINRFVGECVKLAL